MGTKGVRSLIHTVVFVGGVDQVEMGVQQMGYEGICQLLYASARPELFELRK